MAQYDIANTTNPTTIIDYSVDPKQPDSPQAIKENYQYYPNFTTYFGNYKTIAKIKKAIDGYVTFILGLGYECNAEDRVTLDFVRGSGEDTFNAVMWNMLVIKKINGDAFAQIIKDKETGIFLNLKPLNPQFMRTVFNEVGQIIRYDYMKPTLTDIFKSFKPHEILHLMNNRVADEMHGVSDIEAVIWNVAATEEAKQAHRKMVKRNGIVRVIEVDLDNPAKLASYKTQWKTAIDNGDVLIIPKGVAEAKDWHGTLDTAGVVAWLQYLDNDFYMAIGVPRVILGGAENSIEASSKIGTLNFEQFYCREQTELEADIWNQLQIRIKFNKPASLMDVGGVAPSAPNDFAQNQSQTGFQPSDTYAGGAQ